MNNKRQVLLIFGSVVLLLIFGLFFFTNSPKKSVEKVKAVEQEEDDQGKKGSGQEEPDLEETPEKVEEEKEKDIEKEEVPSSNSNTPVSRDPVPSNPTPTVTYHCPDGYSLEGTKCKITTNIQTICPDGYWDYQDGLCINVNSNDSYEVQENETCAEGYGYLTLSQLFGPSTYHCYPVTSKIYTCPDGYQMTGDSCIQIIDAYTN